MMPYYYGYEYSPFFGVFHLVGTVLGILLVIFIIRMIFFRGPRRMRRWQMWHAHDALSILNERFAKGEIDKAEYEERRKTLLDETK